MEGRVERMNIMSKTGFSEIGKKVENGIRLSREDALTLINSNDLISIGQLANMVRERKSGNHAYFNVNRHINLTNICVSRCKFCAFSRDKSDADAYAMTIDDIMEIARSARDLGITEFHIVSGLHPDLPFDYYLDVISRLKETMPDVHIQAFTAVEIAYFTKIARLPVKEVLSKLKGDG